MRPASSGTISGEVLSRRVTACDVMLQPYPDGVRAPHERHGCALARKARTAVAAS